MLHETVAVVSPTTTLTLLGGDADEPPPPQATRRMTVATATVNARNRFISMMDNIEAVIVIVLDFGRSLFFISGTKSSQLLDTYRTIFG